jgi:hypothetical protein
MACAVKHTHQQYALPGIERFIELLPNKPYCTDNKGVAYIRPRHTALKYRYIQPNPPALQHWLVFDLDHSNPWIWQDAGLPEPSLIVTNPENGHSHVYYAIESVCTSPSAKPKPLEYLAAIQHAYTDALQADRGYAGLLAKNPLHQYWLSTVQHTAVFSLGDLAKWVELDSNRWTRKRALQEDHQALGRNCALFYRLRYWAYDWVNDFRTHGTYNDWMKEVLAKCEGYNDFAEPLPYSEVKSTAKSVGKWVWTKYTGSGSGKKRGAMAEQFKRSQLPLSVETKQRLSARRTHEAMRDSTEAKIKAAIANLQEQGNKVTKAAVARLTGITTVTLSRGYKHMFTK